MLPNKANDDTSEKFQKHSNVALVTISLGVSKDRQIIVTPAKTHGKDMESTTDMTAQIDHIKTISEHLAGCGDQLKEKDLVMILISSWPPEA